MMTDALRRSATRRISRSARHQRPVSAELEMPAVNTVTEPATTHLGLPARLVGAQRGPIIRHVTLQAAGHSAERGHSVTGGTEL